MLPGLLRNWCYLKNGSAISSPKQFLWKIFISLNNFLAFKVCLYKLCGFETYVFYHFSTFYLSTFAAKMKRVMIILSCFPLKDLFSYECSCLLLYIGFHENCRSRVFVNFPLGKLNSCPDMNVLGESWGQSEVRKCKQNKLPAFEVYLKKSELLM